MAAGDDHGDAGGARLLGRLELSAHPPHRHAALAIEDEAPDVRGDGLHRLEAAGRGIPPGIAGVEPVDVGEEDQEIGVDEVGDEGGEIVVVANLNLVHRHRVVLVDNGQHPEVHEGEERIARVEIAPAIRDVLPGQ